MHNTIFIERQGSPQGLPLACMRPSLSEMAPCREIPAQHRTLAQHDSLQSSSAPGKGGFMHRLANRIRQVRLSVRERVTHFARSEQGVSQNAVVPQGYC